MPAKSRVLIVDDEEVIANTLAMILNRAGFEACAVYSGESALETAPAFEPDVLISDIIMPGITGIETAIQLRTRFPACRVLLFSGQATSNILEKTRAKGYEFEVLTKPVHPSDLLACLRAAVPATGLDQPRLAAPASEDALSSDWS